MHRLAKLSLNNRSVVALSTAIIAIFGFISLGSLKQELIPSFETPQAAIVTTYIGASPEVVDKQVSQVIDNAVRQQDGLVSSTTTSQANISIVRVEFEYGTSTDQVSEKVAAALASVSSTLPANATAKQLSGSFDSVPIIALGVNPKDGDLDALSVKLEDIAVPALGSISGVREVSLTGTKEKRINLTLKQTVLTANGLSQQSIVSALQANGFVLPAGTIDDKSGSISIEGGTPVNSLAAFENLPLIGTKTSVSTTTPQIPSSVLSQLGGLGGLTGSTGGFQLPSSSTTTTSTVALKIKDVATVKYENAPVTSIARVNGKPSLSLSITKTQDANTVAVSRSACAMFV